MVLFSQTTPSASKHPIQCLGRLLQPVWPWKAIGGRRFSTKDANNMESGVLGPWAHWNYGSQPFIMCINNIENHDSNALATRFDANGKGGLCTSTSWRWLMGGNDWCRREVYAYWWSRRMGDGRGLWKANGASHSHSFPVMIIAEHGSSPS